MTTRRDELHAMAEKQGIPLRTLNDVQADLAAAKKRSKGANAGLDTMVASMMLRHGRLTDEARMYVTEYLK